MKAQPGNPLYTIVSLTLRSLAISATLVTSAFAFAVNLTSNLPNPQLVGAVVSLNATVTGADPGADLVYQFEVVRQGGAFRLLQAFRDNATFNWAALDEGTYLLRVLARDRNTNEIHVATLPFGRISPASGGTVAVLPTAHPQVFIHSTPPCPPGAAALRVAFWKTGNPGPAPLVNATHFKRCVPGKTTTHYVAGLVGDTEYTLVPQVFNAGQLQSGPPVHVTTGPAPIEPGVTVIQAPNANTSLGQDVLLLSLIGDNGSRWFAATNLAGEYIWTYENAGLDNGLLLRPVRGGTFLTVGTLPGGIRSQLLREVDLAGNIVRETNADWMREQLVAAGAQDMGGFHHDARRLPNGHTVVLASVERFADQGNGVELVYGEMVLDLDQNFNLTWSWNSFDVLDVTRPAVLDEKCTNGPTGPSGGCPWLFNGAIANDWLHMNAIDYSPTDGNLILSARHHDAVYKIDYANGTGSGAVIWELGQNGDFALTNGGTGLYPWFSHQHDSSVFGNEIALYDNGNTRTDVLGAGQNSRGQVYVIDEINMTATLKVDADLTHYCPAVGSAQKLDNGAYHFDSGFLGPDFFDGRFAAIEVAPDGTAFNYVQAGLSRAYRSFRMRTLYER